MKTFLKVSSFALLLPSSAQAFSPHIVLTRPTKTRYERASVELRDFLGEKIYASGCIGIFTDGTSLEMQCYPSPSSMPFRAHKEQEDVTAKAPAEEDCEIPYYDGSGEVLCWVS